MDSLFVRLARYVRASTLSRSRTRTNKGTPPDRPGAAAEDPFGICILSQHIHVVGLAAAAAAAAASRRRRRRPTSQRRHRDHWRGPVRSHRRRLPQEGGHRVVPRRGRRWARPECLDAAQPSSAHASRRLQRSECGSTALPVHAASGVAAPASATFRHASQALSAARGAITPSQTPGPTPRCACPVLPTPESVSESGMLDVHV